MKEIQAAILIGDPHALEELYTRNKGLLYKLARRYQGACERDRASSQEDLIQAGYMGLLEGVRAWEPDRGTWVSLAAMYAKKAMRDALGIRSSRIRAEHGALSLDEPLPGVEDGNITRLDLLEDANAPAVDDELLRDDLKHQVRMAVHGLNDASARGIVWAHDIEGSTYRTICESLDASPARVMNMRKKGFRELKSNPRIRALATAYALDRRTRYYAYKGINAFKRDMTSTTEAAAFWRIEQRDRFSTP